MFGKDAPFEEFHLNVELTSEKAKLPVRANDSDAGMDVFSPVSVVVHPWRDVLIPLDMRVEFPKGFAMIFKEKSGRATNDKLDIGACVVDAGYRGIVHCHLFNNSDSAVHIKEGSKVAQFIIVPVWHGQAVRVDAVNMDTDRGEGAFGSTGV